MGSQVKEPMKRVMQTHNACEMCGIVCEILDFVCDNAHIKPEMCEKCVQMEAKMKIAHILAQITKVIAHI